MASSNNKTGFKVIKAGILSLIQDLGRVGHFNIGLTNGGPIDKTAFKWANRLNSNDLNSSVIEVSVGGLELQANCDQVIVLTGANMPLTINNQNKELWQSHFVQAGDIIKLGFATEGLRCYLAIYGGFQIGKTFGSTATVCRENIGGLLKGKNGAHIGGQALQVDDFLPCIQINKNTKPELLYLEKSHQPVYTNEITLRTIPSYQQRFFSDLEQRLFYSNQYTVSQNIDRMGYRLTGRKVTSDLNGILSEGICHGAVQIPNDGQPIVLLNDRQTIGGYPKIGSVIGLDTEKLGQLAPGAKVNFEQISMEDANNILHLNHSLFKRTQLHKIN
ncbi:MAG: biotin-dependent carboxyltransferase [Saccharospirillaceae bacterium]|nr:biotin-dependent carboxyltransferase family protein [Pseudomonadales bacterium]NRB78439.1 biotin-dependent carboxyltransferase [Saccharospirillaceae bacterium]